MRGPAPKIPREEYPRIYGRVRMGESRKALAAEYGVSDKTIGNIVKKMEVATEEERRDAVMRETIITGNRDGGFLTCTGANRFEGTHKMPNGRMESKVFAVDNGHEATLMWEAWCEELDFEYERREQRKAERQRQRDEKRFMDMVARTPRHEADEHDVVVIEEPKPEPEPEPEPEPTEMPGPGRVGAPDGDTVALIVITSDACTKVYGWYGTVERAREAEAELNEFLDFCDAQSIAEVVEVRKRG